LTIFGLIPARNAAVAKKRNLALTLNVRWSDADLEKMLDERVHVAAQLAGPRQLIHLV
jgi:hypothetical protein